jgi:hypothetical protein
MLRVERSGYSPFPWNSSPDAAPDREAGERLDLAGDLQQVVEPLGLRVAAQDDQVGGAAARLGLPGHLPRP